MKICTRSYSNQPQKHGFSLDLNPRIVSEKQIQGKEDSPVIWKEN